MAMTPLVAKTIWIIGCIGWFAIRLPHQRRSRKTPITSRVARARELMLLSISYSGLGVVPAIYVITGAPRFADYAFQPALAIAGTFAFAGALYMFHRSHRDLGRSWSVTLEIRDRHRLITHGVYRLIRHPMYTAFWLWALAQALLLPNWFAGFAGLVGFGTLFFGRVAREERMMLDNFGEEYRAYMTRTYRVIPGVY
jgi:protein-S-isoprenylcysteine O-methyltransferase Ste14